MHVRHLGNFKVILRLLTIRILFITIWASIIKGQGTLLRLLALFWRETLSINLMKLRLRKRALHILITKVLPLIIRSIRRGEQSILLIITKNWSILMQLVVQHLWLVLNVKVHLIKMLKLVTGMIVVFELLVYLIWPLFNVCTKACVIMVVAVSITSQW